MSRPAERRFYHQNRDRTGTSRRPPPQPRAKLARSPSGLKAGNSSGTRNAPAHRNVCGRTGTRTSPTARNRRTRRARLPATAAPRQNRRPGRRKHRPAPTGPGPSWTPPRKSWPRRSPQSRPAPQKRRSVRCGAERGYTPTTKSIR